MKHAIHAIFISCNYIRTHMLGYFYLNSHIGLFAYTDANLLINHMQLFNYNDLCFIGLFVDFFQWLHHYAIRRLYLTVL